jgi:hypothetical protein
MSYTYGLDPPSSYRVGPGIGGFIARCRHVKATTWHDATTALDSVGKWTVSGILVQGSSSNIHQTSSIDS